MNMDSWVLVKTLSLFHLNPNQMRKNKKNKSNWIWKNTYKNLISMSNPFNNKNPINNKKINLNPIKSNLNPCSLNLKTTFKFPVNRKAITKWYLKFNKNKSKLITIKMYHCLLIQITFSKRLRNNHKRKNINKKTLTLNRSVL